MIALRMLPNYIHCLVSRQCIPLARSTHLRRSAKHSKCRAIQQLDQRPPPYHKDIRLVRTPRLHSVWNLWEIAVIPPRYPCRFPSVIVNSRSIRIPCKTTTIIFRILRLNASQLTTSGLEIFQYPRSRLSYSLRNLSNFSSSCSTTSS